MYQFPIAGAFLASLVAAPLTASAQTTSFPLGVLATGTMGPTNPPKPTLGTSINQTSMSRLLSINSVDDFCLLGPPTVQDIADSETIEVAWCTKPRNNARVIPDGTITGVTFIKTDFYVQVMGTADLTKINIPAGDFGGELDPHGALGDGNPVGGNVTSNVTGSDQNFAEWMLYIGNNQFCFRVCTNANTTYSAAAMCWHELDEMGCGFVMPGDYNINGKFQSCEGDVAYPPGWYPTATVSGTTLFSTFAQRFTGTLPGGSVYTIGDLSTPSAPFSTPSVSNCVTTASISNGINLLAAGSTATATTNSATASTTPKTGSTATPIASNTGSGTPTSSSTSSTGTSTPTGKPNSAANLSAFFQWNHLLALSMLTFGIRAFT